MDVEPKVQGKQEPAVVRMQARSGEGWTGDERRNPESNHSRTNRLSVHLIPKGSDMSVLNPFP